MTAPSNEMLRQTVDTFWESFPPFWQRVRAHIREAAAQRFDITVEQFHILRHIRKGLGSVSELAEAKNISRPAISQAVDVLVHKGLIARSPDLQDRRHVQLDLTAEGNTLMDAISDDTRKWMMGILSTLDDRELKALAHAMESLKKTLPV
jgi:DNA-binding MarR family transcriptional regulator